MMKWFADNTCDPVMYSVVSLISNEYKTLYVGIFIWLSLANNKNLISYG